MNKRIIIPTPPAAKLFNAKDGLLLEVSWYELELLIEALDKTARHQRGNRAVTMRKLKATFNRALDENFTK